MEAYVPEEIIGSGAYSTVIKVKKGDSIFALKVIEHKTALHHLVACNECCVLSQLDHPNIVKYIEHFELGDQTALVMEYISGKALYDLLEQEGRMSKEKVVPILRQIVIALQHLHSKGIMHHDLKPENIMISDGVVKLIDFSFSTKEPMDEDQFGTIDYIAPEVIKYEKYTVKIDIWSLGVVLYELLTLQLPFYHKSRNKTKKNICNAKIKFPSSLDEEAKDLLSQMLERNPEKRISLEGILEHPWMK